MTFGVVPYLSTIIVSLFAKLQGVADDWKLVGVHQQPYQAAAGLPLVTPGRL